MQKWRLEHWLIMLRGEMLLCFMIPITRNLYEPGHVVSVVENIEGLTGKLQLTAK